MPISWAFFWAAAEAISAARRLSTGSDRVAESDISAVDVFTFLGYVSLLNSKYQEITMDM